jgi:hypothetical protein
VQQINNAVPLAIQTKGGWTKRKAKNILHNFVLRARWAGGNLFVGTQFFLRPPKNCFFCPKAGEKMPFEPAALPKSRSLPPKARVAFWRLFPNVPKPRITHVFKLNLLNLILSGGAHGREVLYYHGNRLS